MDQSNTPTTEPLDSEGQSKYLLHSRDAIANVLHDLAKKPDIITAYFNHGNDYVLTAVLSVVPERNLLVLDYGADEQQNRRLLEAGKAFCVAKHEHISIKFSCRILQKARFQERPAFAALLPDTLYRLQRREYFRVSTPTANPVRVFIPTPDGGEVELVAFDISGGGIGLLDPTMALRTEAAQRLDGCRIVLPDSEPFVCDLEVRHVAAQQTREGRPMQRIGVAFCGLPQDKHGIVQRYVHRLQIAQKALLGR